MGRPAPFGALTCIRSLNPWKRTQRCRRNFYLGVNRFSILCHLVYECPEERCAKKGGADVAQGASRIVENYVVTCAQLGDRAAQEHLVARYQPRFLRHAFRLLGKAEPAKDAVQDGWIEILRGLRKLKDSKAFPAWAFRIVTRRCAKHIARVQKARKTMEALSGEPVQDTRAEDEIEHAADRGPLRRALAGLPVGHRAAVALFYLEEMTVAGVAVALDVPVGTVKSRLMNARSKLREAVEGNGMDASRVPDVEAEG